MAHRSLAGIAASRKQAVTRQLFSSDIVRVELLEDADLGVCLSGGDTAECRYGVWKNDRAGEYVLYAYQSTSPVIQISTAEEDYWIALENGDIFVYKRPYGQTGGMGRFLTWNHGALGVRRHF